ncbi:phosphate signaling complex protein PhoU [Georgenia deserti]|uniref:Phosphate-specific transport system accessory protein PhoU n=1 Tax=Georgenia deserti TaxID=2093781 RepID=A0ABW4L9B4_9MICO
MREIFKQEIEQLGLDLASMAEQMSTAIGKAVTALEQADLALAEQVIDADEKIDAIQHNIDEQAVSLLARQQPVATDLRVVITALRMSSTLERMGDLARHVADVARGRYPETAARGAGHDVLMRMGRQAVNVGDQVVRLVNTQDLDLAASIESEDSVLDQLHEESFQVVLDETVELPRQEIVDVVLLGRYLERFGDHGVSIARRISFLVTGDLTNAVATETNGTDVQ